MAPSSEAGIRKQKSSGGAARWVIPYIDQPVEFWERVVEAHGDRIREVYFPLPGGLIGSGEPMQPDRHLQDLLRSGVVPCSVLLNGITLPRPVEEAAPPIIESVRRLVGEYGIVAATVTNLSLAARVREALPDLPLTASCLMQISMPNQVAMLEGIIDNIVPDIRINRDLPALRTLKESFSGRIRFMVNECCLPGCPFRVQHFYEMGGNLPHPHSLCVDLLQQQPWMRLTSGWVLPQHLHLYDGVYDDLKIAGRVTLRDPAFYRHVVDAYIRREPLRANELGGGPGTVIWPIPISEEFFRHTLTCGHNCHQCSFCRDYYTASMKVLADRQAPSGVAAKPQPDRVHRRGAENAEGSTSATSASPR